MSIICGLPFLECVYCLGCARWVWKKCLYSAGHESENWGLGTAQEFEPIPRYCRFVLAVYEEDLRNPIWAPPGGYGMNPDWLILRKDHERTQGCAPPYMIYLDHDNHDIVLVVRGLNLAKESDYAVLLDNKLGQTKFQGGYVHNGLLKAAKWIFNAEVQVLKDLLDSYPSYTLTFTGHSLGAGVVALLAMYVVQCPDKLSNIERKRVRCYAIAPVRCMSLNLAVRYADVINSIVLQDDFLPRTTAGLEDVFRSLIWWIIGYASCLRDFLDTCTFEEKMLKDPRRLYAPGRLYHIVDRKPFRLGRFPPVVRTAVPVDGRFEHVVLSCNATSDHTIIWIERESQRALDLMLEIEGSTEMPPRQKMERQESLARDPIEEYKAALERALALQIPEALSPSGYGTFIDIEEGESSESSSGDTSALMSIRMSIRKKIREGWDKFVDRMFDVDDETGHMVFKKQTSRNNQTLLS